MKSTIHGNHNFAKIPKIEIPRSVFDRSHGHKTTFNENQLVPFYLDEALPGDTFKAHTTLFARLATPIVPIMDNLFMDTFYFAVPYRLIWEHWEQFNGASDTAGIQPTEYLIPTLQGDVGGVQVGDIFDHMGLPLGRFDATPEQPISALPFRAYNLIYNEWFRDQNLIDKVDVPLDDGPDPQSTYQLLNRGKRHDYFTSCLPWPQKGPGVEISIGGEAKVYGNGNTLSFTDGTSEFGLYTIGGSSAVALGIPAGLPVGGTATNLQSHGSDIAIGVTNDATSGLYADLSTATSATINTLRQAFQLQRMYEKDARGGTRYTEILRAHFSVVSPDSRLQRPEYLGGSSQRISINPVQQTSSTDSTSPQGNLAAFGMMADNKGGFTKSFVEHCLIIGLVNVRADLTYQQGIPRMFSRRTRFDHYWPSLAHLGEQEVLNKEIMFTNDSTNDEAVFGYQERFAEYRYFPSQITGDFRSTAPLPLDVWHLAQKFTSLPGLNQAFIEENVPISRVIAVPSQPHFLFDSYMELHCARPMPVYGVPGLIDHF